MQRQPTVPTWLNTDLYPFSHQFLPVEGGNMHYVEAGQGPILLFVHGTPTWSFLYRDFIKELSSDYRCIAIDHLGFGLSEKWDDSPGTPEWHANNLSIFIKELDLQDITLVVHDFGGPIGLGSGIENSERIAGVVLFNSWLWETASDKSAQRIDRLVNSWLGSLLYLRLNFSPRVLLKQGFADKNNLTKAKRRHYRKPFPDKPSRVPLLDLAKALLGSSDWYQQQWEALHRLSGKEWLILWGTEDKFLTSDQLLKWRSRLPEATVREWSCGHFVQEEETELAISAIRTFMGSSAVSLKKEGAK